MAQSRNPHIPFVRGDVTRLPFGDGQFDAVCLRTVLLHLPSEGDALVALQEVRRVIKPNGLVFIRVKKKMGVDKFVTGIDKRTNSPRLFQLFTETDLRTLLGAAGLKEESLWLSVDDDNPELVCINVLVRKAA
jgi:ubiquinone/menaquinone biosynthesis C-methylase UbiE